jgi:hypothetical protein
VTRLGRLVRGRRLDRNPLRRRSDRAETVAGIVLAVVFLAGAPIAALAAGGWARGAAQRAALSQTASWRQVTAVVLETPGPPAFRSGDLDSVAKARWTAPDGSPVTGRLPVTYGTKAGATLRVWVTRDGHIAQPPMNDPQVASLALTAEVAGVVILANTVAVAWALTRWGLNKGRMARWDADWQATGPRWTTHA